MVLGRFLEDDIREKKRDMNTIKRSRSNRSGASKMLLPSDIMSRKDKYNHRKGGKVVTYSVFETVMSYEEFLKLDTDTKKKTMLEYRKRHSNESIRKQWGLSTYEYFTKLLGKELGILDNKKPKKKEKAEPVKKEQAVPVEAYLIQEAVQKAVEQQAPVQAEEPEGFAVRVKGTYSAKDVVKRLEKLTLVLDDELETEYEVHLVIKEKVKN